jgi:hypothetical protein
MANVNRLNRSGPLSFSELTLGSPYTSISDLLGNIESAPTQNVSVSASLSLLRSWTGDPIDNIKKLYGVGTGLVSYDDVADAKLSEFYGANYLSASVKPNGSGRWDVKIWPDSVVYNSNYLTQETSSRVYRYSVYSKPNPPNIGTPFVKQSAYVKSNVAEQSVVNLTSDRIYKVVLKDVVSNAFTSSFFTGSCGVPAGSVGSNVYLDSGTQGNISAARDQMIATAAASSLNSDRKSDVIQIANILATFVNQPNTLALTGYVRNTTSTNSWPAGGTRSFDFEGFISRIVQGGNYYAGLVTCSGGNPFGTVAAATYQYGIDQVYTTSGQSSIVIFALAPVSSISGCSALPTDTISNIVVTQNCFSPAQTINPLVTTADVNFTGSAIFVNPSTNAHSATYTLNADWINTINNKSLYTGNQQLLPAFSPSTFTLSVGQSKKVTYTFGENYWHNAIQSSSFSTRGSFTAVFSGGATLVGYITSTMDKNVCMGSGGDGGSGGCPAAWQLMETKELGFIPAKEIVVGMHLRDPQIGVWNRVNVAYISRAPIYRTIIDGVAFDVDNSHKWPVGNDIWTQVVDIKPGDTLEGVDNKPLFVNDNYLLFEDAEYMHLNCDNHRFVMGSDVIGHNATSANVGMNIKKF